MLSVFNGGKDVFRSTGRGARFGGQKKFDSRSKIVKAQPLNMARAQTFAVDRGAAGVRVAASAAGFDDI